MKISARNVLQGKVSAVKRGAVNSEVELSLPGNGSVVAVVTNESVENLGLRTDVSAYAIIKAPLVVIAQDVEGMKFSTRNVLKGTVRKITHGTVNSVVTIGLADGINLSAIITEQSTEELGLRESGDAYALFKASSVILAVQG